MVGGTISLLPTFHREAGRARPLEASSGRKAALMSLISSERINRTIVRVFFSIVLFLILALPVPSPDRSPIRGVAAAFASSSSSPDETLNPPPTPPKRSSKVMKPAPGISGHVIGSRAFLGMMWRIYWSTVRL